MSNSTNTKSKVAIIDDEVDMRESVAQWLQLSGFEPICFDAAEPALKVIGPDFPGVVISDIRMPGMDGMALLRRLQSIDPGLPVILMTGHGDVPMAVEAMRIGAFDFVEKPFEPDRLADLCQRGGEARARTLETRALRRELADGSVVMRRLMGSSPAVEKLRETILDVAQADGHVLVLGETGTGKSLIAMALHACGPRAAKPLVTMNCASVAQDAVEPTLFGGPEWPEKPLIDQAEGGTLCLEDIEALSPSAQARLLDAINANDPNGAARHNIRITAVSSRLGPGAPPPEVLRDDLYFRLAGLVIEAPPLARPRRGHPDALLAFHHPVRRGVRLRAADAGGGGRGEPGAGALAGQHPPAHQPRRTGGAAGAARRQQHLGAAHRRRLPGAGLLARRGEAVEGARGRLREDADRPRAPPQPGQRQRGDDRAGAAAADA